jgi:hypothetical protein
MSQIRLRRVSEGGFFSLPVEVSANETPESWRSALLLVDTGASAIFLGERFARSLEYEPGPPRVTAGGLTGRQELATIRNVGVRLGGQVPSKVYLSYVPVLPGESGMPEQVDGIAGFGLFQRLRATLTVDYDTNIATLTWP